MAGNETDEISIRALVSFYLTPESGKVNGQPIHKEKFNVPMEREAHKEFLNFQAHLASFTGLGVNTTENTKLFHLREPETLERTQFLFQRFLQLRLVNLS